jgi:hypothetical protein
MIFMKGTEHHSPVIQADGSQQTTVTSGHETQMLARGVQVKVEAVVEAVVSEEEDVVEKIIIDLTLLQHVYVCHRHSFLSLRSRRPRSIIRSSERCGHAEGLWTIVESDP